MFAGLLAPQLRRISGRRTHALIAASLIATGCLAGLGLTRSFPLAVGFLVGWGLTFSIGMPMRQAYINGIIPTQHRATVLSFDSLMSSAGGVVAQPALGRVADLFGYSRAYVVSALLQLTAVPFLALARRENATSDLVEGTDAEAVAAGNAVSR
jgi:MFS family permease